MLQARKVPFVFMTGYGTESIAVPFPNVRVFQKPLEREVLRELFVANDWDAIPSRAAASAR